MALGCFGISLGNRRFPAFFVLSIAVLVLVLDFLHRLGSNVIFEAIESIGSRDIYLRGLGSAFSSTSTISLSTSTSTSEHF
jgi:hypothetical protein